MRTVLFPLFLVSALLLPHNVQSQAAQKSAPTQDPISGRWIVIADLYGTPVNFSLELKVDGEKLTGNFEGDKLEGTLTGKSVHFLGKDEQGGTEECEAKVQDGTMSGMLIFTDPSDAAHPATNRFTATRVP